MPFQLVMRRSSPSSRPYEHASSMVSAVDTGQDTLHGCVPTCSEAFLALLQLLQQSEVARDLGTHDRQQSLVLVCEVKAVGSTV